MIQFVTVLNYNTCYKTVFNCNWTTNFYIYIDICAQIYKVLIFQVFKLATSCCTNMNNYMVLNMSEGVYTYTFAAEKRPDCVACSNTTRTMEIESNATLQAIYNKLCEDKGYLMKSPGEFNIIFLN